MSVQNSQSRSRSSSGRPGASRRSASISSPYPAAVDRLIEEFSKLPGIGRRTAERLAFHVLKSSRDEAFELAGAIRAMKESVGHCSICFNLAEEDPCRICTNPRRERESVMVVEQPRDLIALEQTGMYRGLYHVLLGRISPLEDVGPEDLTVDRLLQRLADPTTNAGGDAVTELILGLNPTLEGDGTALLLAEEAHKRGVRVTRLARGLPAGSQLEFANKAVLADAIAGRQRMD